MIRQDPLSALFLPTLYEGSPKEKLACARFLAHSLRSYPKILADLNLVLPALTEAVRELAKQMDSMGMGLLCCRCAATSGGGCCSAFMAANCDVPQLLLNLLLHGEIDMQEYDRESCAFLGPKGCLFTVKPIFCLNYNCQHILLGSSKANLQSLYAKAASVLSQQLFFENNLLTFLSAHLHILTNNNEKKMDENRL